MKFKEFLLETSIYDEETIDDKINDFFKGKNVDIIDVEYIGIKECDSSNKIYLRALVTYQEPLLLEISELEDKII